MLLPASREALSAKTTDVLNRLTEQTARGHWNRIGELQTAIRRGFSVADLWASCVLSDPEASPLRCITSEYPLTSEYPPVLEW